MSTTSTTPKATHAATTSRWRQLAPTLKRNGLLIFFALLLVVFTIARPEFLSQANIGNDTNVVELDAQSLRHVIRHRTPHRQQRTGRTPGKRGGIDAQTHRLQGGQLVILGIVEDFVGADRIDFGAGTGQTQRQDIPQKAGFDTGGKKGTATFLAGSLQFVETLLTGGTIEFQPDAGSKNGDDILAAFENRQDALVEFLRETAFVACIGQGGVSRHVHHTCGVLCQQGRGVPES